MYTYIRISIELLYIQIHQFTLQLIHHPLNFTGLGLFNFGYSFVQNVSLYQYSFYIIFVKFYYLLHTLLLLYSLLCNKTI